MRNIKQNLQSIFKKQAALPADHGSWVFLLSPFLIGVFAASGWTQDITTLLIGLLSLFLVRQPASLLVKALSKRRSRKSLPAAFFWLGVYALIGSISMFRLAQAGFGYLLWLALPGIAVFAWHLWLVSRREERYQMGVDIIASGVLALAAPAAYWVSSGSTAWTGWALWLLVWLQSASSIVYAFLRLAQRRLEEPLPLKERLLLGKRALLYSGFNLTLAAAFSVLHSQTSWIWLPYLLQLLESIWGVLKPATGWKPTTIGLRQLAVSSIFTIAFILTWNL